jgi:hypothetical protein
LGEVAGVEGEEVGQVGEAVEGVSAERVQIGGRVGVGGEIVHAELDERSFSGGVAAEAPLGVDHLGDEAGLDGVGRLEALEVPGAEGVESFGVLVVEEEGLVRAEAVLDGVEGRGGFTGFGFGTFGFGAAAAGSVDSFLRASHDVGSIGGGTGRRRRAMSASDCEESKYCFRRFVTGPKSVVHG